MIMKHPHFERPGQMWFLIHRDPTRRNRPYEISRHPSRDAALNAADDNGMMIYHAGQPAKVLMVGYWVVPEEVAGIYLEKGPHGSA